MASIKKAMGISNPKYQDMIAKHHSPEGGLRGIRLRNGWDDNLPPVVRPEFLANGRVRRTAEDSESKL